MHELNAGGRWIPKSSQIFDFLEFEEDGARKSVLWCMEGEKEIENELVWIQFPFNSIFSGKMPGNKNPRHPLFF